MRGRMGQHSPPSRENEGEGDAEVVLGEGLALIGGVGLVVDVEGVVPWWTWTRIPMAPGKE